MENNFDSGTVFQVRAQNRHDPVVNGNYFGLSVGLCKTEQEAQERVVSAGSPRELKFGYPPLFLLRRNAMIEGWLGSDSFALRIAFAKAK